MPSRCVRLKHSDLPHDFFDLVGSQRGQTQSQ
jgi:hypothetical protein